MKILIRNAEITGAESNINGQKLDILIIDGKIEEIGKLDTIEADKTIQFNDLVVSPGWVEIFSNFADPGYEYKETISSGAKAAAKGGFTDVFVIPNTKPVLDAKAQIEYITTRSLLQPVNVYPIAAVTKNTQGNELSEMYDMHQSGAIAFSDGLHPVQSSGIMLKALQYIKSVQGTLIQIPDDTSIGTHGLINEGIISTSLGLPGKPVIAEEVMIARDLKLLEYTDSKIHFTGVSSPVSLQYIQEAKEKGLQVTCSVTPYHLFFSDEDLLQYDTNLKVYPHLRTRKQKDLLKEAVLNGTIDCIATHHMPHETDSKGIEFEYAKYGMIGLETCLNLLLAAIPEISTQQIANLLSLNQRKIFGLQQNCFQKGAKASLTLYSKNGSNLISENFFQSKSKNSPLTGKELPGVVYGIINKEIVFLNS